MSGGANKSFLKNPLEFINDNVIVPHNSLQVVAKGQATIVRVNIIADTTGNTCLDTRGNNVPMFRATGVKKKPSIASNAFYAYYLPYAPNQTRQMNLGTGAKFFFTDKIDGCTLAAGTNGGVNPLVIHMNQQTATGRIDQPAIDNTIQGLYGTNPFAQLSLPDYISPEEYHFKNNPNSTAVKTNVTVIGIRTGQNWNFYYQRRNWLGGMKYRLVDTTAGYTAI